MRFRLCTGRSGADFRDRYPSLFEYTLLWYMFEFLGRIVYSEYLFHATPFFSGDKRFLSVFRSPIVVMKGRCKCATLFLSFGLVHFLGVKFEACSVCHYFVVRVKNNKEGCSLVVIYAMLHFA